jgi:SAM-dependent methyltransferase
VSVKDSAFSSPSARPEGFASPAQSVPSSNLSAGAFGSYAHHGCCFCGHPHCPPVLERPQYVVRRCPHCTVLWCDPMRFGERFCADNEKAYLEFAEISALENAVRLNLLERYAPAGSHRNLIEIGSMHGNFIAQARVRGYSAEGYDLSRTAVDEANRHIPGLVRYGTLDGSIPSASVDVVAAFNVIEHMDAPNEFLDHVVRVLRSGGVLIAETPAQESIYHAVMYARCKVQRSARELEIGLHPGTHIFKFGHRAWRTILGDRNFRILTCRSKSTPLRELLTKTRSAHAITRAGIVGFGALARLTRLGNRVILVAEKPPREARPEFASKGELIEDLGR